MGTNSIKSTSFHSISTGFHKCSDLFWDRWSHLLNHLKINDLQNYLHRVTTDPVGVSSFPDVEFLKRCAEFVKEVVVNRLLAFLPRRPSMPLASGQVVGYIALAIGALHENSMQLQRTSDHWP